MTGNNIVVSGMRPTGPLHLGHLEGVLRNWVKLQHQYPCYFFVADLHCLTDKREPGELAPYTIEMVRDWIACGLDPEKTTLFVQSSVPGHVYLATLLGMVAPVSWLERCPTYKDRVAELGASSANLGLLSYPVLMAADVALYDATLVPVGDDQVPHLELAREVVRKFNAAYPAAALVEPQPLLNRTPRLSGTDGKKMSKSYANTLDLAAAPDVIANRVRGMKTDENRKRRTDPGSPENCNLYPWHEIYSAAETDAIRRDCTTAAMGCTDCKGMLLKNLEPTLSEIRAKRAGISDDRIRDVLAAGSKKAAAVSQGVLDRLNAAVGFYQ